MSRMSLIQLSAIPTSELDGGVFSTEDIIVGLILGILLALMTSFLQGRRSQNDFVLWENNKEREEYNNTKPSLSSATASALPIDELEWDFATNSTTITEPSAINDLSIQESRSTVFDGNDWKEMSRPENYVFYNRNLKKKKKKKEEEESPEDSEQIDEQRWIVLALLVLFVPIFSVEFFFALSRQILCGGDTNGLLSSMDAAQFLCSPVR
ncbi:unnamed protein product [Cylindrotheca closterium]|uniref:Uncharacterized protein n=1 Tax=Cylindrotheca closterium TaxID=2856 RepID=A0AAD2CF07_9STRA|nr:unnamed protein product [Cylindrotheca closterium]